MSSTSAKVFYSRDVKNAKDIELFLIGDKVNSHPHNVGFYEKWEGTKCAIHSSLLVVDSLDGGCRDMELGKAGHFKNVGLHGPGYPCVVEAGTRTNDGKFCDLLRGVRYVKPAWKYGNAGRVLNSLKGTMPFTVEDMGKGYCYADSLDPYLRMRTARDVGPLCQLTDWFWSVWVAGEHEMQPWKLTYVGVGCGQMNVEQVPFYHFELLEGKRENSNIRRLLVLLAQLIEASPTARVGWGGGSEDESDGEFDRTDHYNHRGSVLLDHGYISFGVGAFNKPPVMTLGGSASRVVKTSHVSDLLSALQEATGDYDMKIPLGLLYVVTTAKVELVGAWEGSKRLQKDFSALGDVVMKQFAVRRAIHSPNPGQLVALLRSQENDALAQFFSASFLKSSVSPSMAAGSPGMHATCLEGIVGLMAYYTSTFHLDKFCNVLGLFTDESQERLREYKVDVGLSTMMNLTQEEMNLILTNRAKSLRD